jgi:uncharacterized membrane protein YkvA (DUF1232 family)
MRIAWGKWLAIGSLRKASLLRQLTALWFMLKEPTAPLLPKLLAFALLAYALSPIDLIPDFIPVLGWLDDLILLPIGLTLVVWLVPRPLWQAMLDKADLFQGRLPKMLTGLIVVLLIWAALIIAFGSWLVSELLHA